MLSLRMRGVDGRLVLKVLARYGVFEIVDCYRWGMDGREWLARHLKITGSKSLKITLQAQVFSHAFAR